MKVAILVTCSYSVQTIHRHKSDFTLSGRWDIFGDDFIEVVFHEFKDEVKTVFLSNNFLELDYIMVVHFAEWFDFAQLHGLVPRSELGFHAFDGNDLIGGLVAGLGHTSERPVTHGL